MRTKVTMKLTTKWPTGIGSAIVANRKRHAEMEVRRVRFVLALFLRKCSAMMEQGYGTGVIRGTAADLEVGECSVVEYVEGLIAQAYDQADFVCLGPRAAEHFWFSGPSIAHL